MKEIEILDVKRTKKGDVRSVLVQVDHITILFIWKNGRPYEVSRVGPGDRLYDPATLWIPDPLYNKMIRQVCAIFVEGEKQKSKKGGKR